MGQLPGGCTALEGARVGRLQDDDAARLDTLVRRVYRRRHEVGEGHVGDEAAALLDVQDRLFSVAPLLHRHSAAQHAGVDPHVGDRFGQGERPPPDLTPLARLGRRGPTHVILSLLGRPLLA